MKHKEKAKRVAEIKKSLPEFCAICGIPCKGDAAHLLPKSTYPQYYTEPKNIVRLCRDCHNRYDNDKAFRAERLNLLNKVREFATHEEIFRYYGI